MLTDTGFIRGILRGVRYAKSLRVLFSHRRSPSWTTLVLYSRVVFFFNEPSKSLLWPSTRGDNPFHLSTVSYRKIFFIHLVGGQEYGHSNPSWIKWRVSNELCHILKGYYHKMPKNHFIWLLDFYKVWLGLGTEFRSEKFHRIDSERFLLFRGRKHSFRGIPSSAEEPIPKLGTEWNSAEKIIFTKQQQNNLTKWCRFLCHGMVRNGLFLFFVTRKGIPSCVLFRGMVRNGILRICIYFVSTERNSELCSLL